jgi:mannose-1-phosphate guanylyltransferase
MKNSGLWSIILAGGEGERVRPLVQRWLGQPKPKQYCTFIGRRSMLEHTLNRADMLTRPDHRVTVIARSHRQEAGQHFAKYPGGIVLEQPINRDTAAGIFFPLTFIRARDPQATVIIYPADHFVFPEERFVAAVQSAVRAVEQLGDKLVLLGVAPDRLELEYGWITPGAQLCLAGGRSVRSVERFFEKPDLEGARTALFSGGLWSTLVFAAKVESLWEMGWKFIPEMMPHFETWVESIGSSAQERVLEYLYRRMPERNFSSDLLARAHQQAAVIELADAQWCDWGKPERIADSIVGMGKQPAFPLECVKAS